MEMGVDNLRAQALVKAKLDKNDEFYTQLKDIENELQHYKQHFKSKTIFMNADNPKYSQFWKYFKDNFDNLGLQKIISTYYNPDGKYLLEAKAYKTEYDGIREIRTELTGDGDFRSQEVIDIMKTADIVVTNPPFSLFKDLMKILHENNKKFILVGHQNSITQKLTFKLIKEKKIWLGRGFPGNVGYFINKHYEDYAVSGDKIEGLIRVSGVFWYTNLSLDDGREPLKLTETYTPEKFPKYDNYNAINVDRVLKMPKDYFGEMGVPITFMNKYVPEQFEIIGLDTYLYENGGTRFMIAGKTKYARIVIKRKV